MIKSGMNNREGSSFHGVTVRVSPNQLIDLCNSIDATYEECNTGEDKSNFDFEFTTEEGLYFTVYDWKEYHSLDDNTEYNFHIGARDAYASRIALEELEEALNGL